MRCSAQGRGRERGKKQDIQQPKRARAESKAVSPARRGSFLSLHPLFSRMASRGNEGNEGKSRRAMHPDEKKRSTAYATKTSNLRLN